MEARQQCMSCKYAVPDPLASADVIMAGQRQTLCVGAPPVPCAVPQVGRLVIMTMYPPVNDKTVSCRLWQSGAMTLTGLPVLNHNWLGDDSNPAEAGE